MTEEEILTGAAEAFEGGWNRVKLYFMLGLPTETVEDMEGIALLSEKIAEAYYEIPKEQRNGKVQVVGQHLLLCAEAFYPLPVGKNVHEGRIPGKSPSWSTIKCRRNAES